MGRRTGPVDDRCWSAIMREVKKGGGITAKGERRLERIEVACAPCGHVKVLESPELEPHLDKPLTIRSVREVLDRLRCTECRSKQVAVKDDRGTMIYDADRCTTCPECGLPRLLPELALHSAGALCPACAEETKSRPPPPHPMPPKGKDKCPRCGAGTLIYERRVDGDRFIGCSRFPSCRWSCDL